MKLRWRFTLLAFGAMLSPVVRAEVSPDQNPGSLPRTVIDSDRLELVTSEIRNQFFFEGNVRVSGTNLQATCDRMEVWASRVPDSDGDAMIGEMGAIEHIIAIGSVRIIQAGRTAEAGRAEILPREGKVVLTENPRITDDRGVIATGPRMVLHQGERRAVIDGWEEGADQDRPRVVLPTLPDLGFDQGDGRRTESGTDEARDESTPSTNDP